MNIGQYAKMIVAVAGAAAQLLTHYSGSWWEPPVAALITAATVYLVPNSGSSGAVSPPR